MNLPFTRDAFLDVFGAYNQLLWPVAVVLWLMTARALATLLRDRRGEANAIAWMLALQWAWMGAIYHATFFSAINPAAWLFAAMFLIEAALFVHRARRLGGLTFSQPYSLRWIAGAGLVIYALGYPFIAAAIVNPFPRTPTFGVPCPGVIATIGFLLAADPPVPRTLALIPIAWAFIGGSAARLLGVPADFVLLGAGVVLTLELVGRTLNRRPGSAAPGGVPHPTTAGHS